MTNNSRIRFNPVTKEIEVEGSEAFVKTYFDKLQAMISDVAEKKSKETRGARTNATRQVGKRGKSKRVTNISAVLGLIQKSREGISTAEIQKKTGLSEHQIWSIVDRAAKAGKVRKIKRGLYGTVAAG